VDTRQRGLGFQGVWYGDSGTIIHNNRYYLEDKPHYLDSPGEFWFDRQGDGGRLYIRLPGDRDPNSTRVEVAKRIHVIESTEMSSVHITGLTFRFTNVFWELTATPWWVSHVSKDVEPACIRLLGPGGDIRVSNCRFEHVHGGIRLKAEGGRNAIDGILISDNVFGHTDRCAIEVSEGANYNTLDPPIGRVFNVRILRNKLEHIGMRPDRFGQGQALTVSYAETVEVAGNFLNRCYSAGINVLGGKASRARTDRPFCRILIHHNKVVDPLLNNDDFGGIETWQGGPAYVYNNISGNPGGYRNWDNVLSPDTEDRFGHAYYLDGAFKNYLFNNIAWGKSKGPSGPLANTSALQEIHSYQNAFFNNTFYNFVRGSRRQAPHAGRNKFLANIWQSMGIRVFRDADPARTPAAGNEAHAGPQRAHFALETNAYSGNVFYDIGEHFGVLEPSGRWLDTLETFREALSSYGPLADDVGLIADASPLRDPANHDFRLAPGSAALEQGVKAFAPWSLYATVGEWSFLPIKGDPSRVMDEHWFMTPYHVRRENYAERPMYPLQAVNVSAEDYTDGPLEDWTNGALALNGRDQYAVLTDAKLDEPFGQEVTYRAPNWGTMTVPAAIAPGQRCQISVKLEGVEEPMKVKVDLHWGKDGGAYGGFNAWGGDAKDVKGEGPYVFTFMPQDQPGLTRYIPTVYLTTTGEWADRTLMAQTDVPKGEATGQATSVTMGGGQVTETRGISGPDLKNPEVHNSNFLLEACFRTAPGHTGGVLIEKMAGSGYSLAVDGAGRVAFAAEGLGGSADVTGATLVNDGEWHHVIAESDRAAGTLTVYVDGKIDVTGPGIGPDVSLANDGDLCVGGTPDGRCLEGALEFARIALGTLADAKTTIEELYAWQFDGPFLRDFCGNDPVGRRDAGAIEVLQ
jgi:hypothetical protein